LIGNLSKVVKLFTNLTKDEFKGKKFIWSQNYEEYFKKLKDLFTSAPIYWYFEPKLITTVEINPSNFTIGAMPSQLKDKYFQTLIF
jgi:hypothetical protein